MPEDVYQVTGRSTVKPENLPPGLQVKKYQRQVQDTIPSRSGSQELVLKEHLLTKSLVLAIVHGPDYIVLDRAGMRRLRDKIDAVLGEEDPFD